MREFIVRALEWIDALLLTKPGRHSAAYFDQQEARDPALKVSAWSKPWTTARPPHVIARDEPIYDDGPLIRPEYRMYLAQQEEEARVGRRRREVFWASMGLDYPGVPLRGAR